MPVASLLVSHLSPQTYHKNWCRINLREKHLYNFPTRGFKFIAKRCMKVVRLVLKAATGSKWNPLIHDVQVDKPVSVSDYAQVRSFQYNININSKCNLGRLLKLAQEESSFSTIA